MSDILSVAKTCQIQRGEPFKEHSDNEGTDKAGEVFSPSLSKKTSLEVFTALTRPSLTRWGAPILGGTLCSFRHLRCVRLTAWPRGETPMCPLGSCGVCRRPNVTCPARQVAVFSNRSAGSDLLARRSRKSPSRQMEETPTESWTAFSLICIPSIVRTSPVPN